MLQWLPSIVGSATGQTAAPDESGGDERDGADPGPGSIGEGLNRADVANADAGAVVQSLLDGLEYPIHVVDDEAHITRVNRECLDLFEKTEEELIGVCLFDLDEADNSVMREVLDTGDPVRNLEETIEVESGTVPVSRSVLPLFDADGEITGAFEINRDISERTELERRERILEAYQETVVEEIQVSLARLADGDLTVEPRVPEPEEDFEAIRNVHETFSSMAADLREAVDSLRTALEATRDRSDELSRIGAETQTAADEVRAAIADLGDASDSVAATAERQAERTAEAEENVSSLSASIEEITATVEQIDTRAQTAAELAEEGTETAHEAIETIDEASAASERNVEMIEELEAQMGTINRTTEMIADIADQTNLLALNANIEAARAEGEGSGFQVVADEVKELAEESKATVEEISDSLEEVKAGVNETAEAVARSNRQVETGVNAVREVVEDIERIESSIRETSEGLEEIRRATADQADDAETVSRLVEDVSEAGQDVSAEIQEVVANVDTQAEAIQEVATASEELTEMSEGMRDLLADFRLRAAETDRAIDDASSD
ncbi:methyl-accepting chemotaxis protein [Halobacteriales archaeon QS_1_67_19]|nr:MAG: methyl-accepting chemotaxis protein [Halobacteriales archaeon QS_1_67_19]